MPHSGMADWYRAKNGETAGGKRTKSIDDVSKGNNSYTETDVRIRGG